MTEILPNTKNDIGNRGCTNETLAKFKGLPRQTIVNVADGYRLIVMDGSTLGGKFKTASIDELQEVRRVASSALTKNQADTYYVAKGEKVQAANTADTATSALKATQDAMGNTFTTHYASRTELSQGLANKLNIADAFTVSQADNRYLLKGSKISSASMADRAVADGEGNDITTTYAKKSAMDLALNSKQDSATAFTRRQADALYLGKSEKVSSALTADKALALSTRHHISLTGAITSSSPAFDGSEDVSISVTSINGAYVTPFKGATNYSAGSAGSVPAPSTGAHNKFLRGDGTWQSPEHTDTRVMQSHSSTNSEYAVLAKDSVGSSNTTSSTVFASGITINPYTNTITASTFKGSLEGSVSKASTADIATKATQDAQGNTIHTTYATKQDLQGKLDVGAKVAKATLADRATTADSATVANSAGSVTWAGITGKPNLIPKNGDTGTITVMETLTSASTVDDNSARSLTLSTGGTLTVSNGTAGKAWITVVALDGSASINLGSSWQWANGTAPTLAKGIVSLAWYGSFGIASFTKYGQ